MTLRRICVLSLLLVFFVAVAKAGQVVTGSVSGTIMDRTGAFVPGADVTLTNSATNATEKTVTSDTGTFRFTQIPAGQYLLEVSKPGFQKLLLGKIEVDVNVERALGTLELQLGQATESVKVIAAPPLVEAAQAQVSTTFTSDQIQTYSGVGENEGLDFMALSVPGVGNTRDNNFADTNGVGFSVNGIRGRSNDQQIDGQNNNDNSVTGPALVLSDPDFVSEYQITTSNFGPEYGRNSGSVVNILTKSGTNNWHGTIFGQETNSVFTTLTNIEKYYTTPPLTKPPRFNQEFSGGTIGGPLAKNRVFIFGGFDDQIMSSKATFQSGALTPTPLGINQLSACFPGSTSMAALRTYGPFGITGGGPTISGVSTVAYYDDAPINNTTDPTTGAPACGYQLAGVQRTAPNGSYVFDFVTRLDIVASNADSLYFRYLFQKLLVYNLGDIAGGYPFNGSSLRQSVLIDWDHTFSNQMVNQLRIAYSRLNVDFGTNTLGNTVPSANQAGEALTDAVFLSGALLGFGVPLGIPQGRVVNTYQLQDNFQYSLGVHQLKWGINLINQRSSDIGLRNYNGFYVFTDYGALAANTPNSVSITSGDPSSSFKEWDTFLYIGDDWKVKSNLTLNLGLTWSYFGQPANLFHQQTVKQQTGPNPFWNPALPLSVTTSPVVGAVYDLFGPGIGFAWSPGGLFGGNGKTVLRGGYRLTYDPPSYDTFAPNGGSAPVVLAQTLIAPAAGLPAAPFGPAIRAEYASDLTPGVFDPRNFNRSVTPSTFRPDKVSEWSFGIQRSITNNAAFEVRYIGNTGSDLFQYINAYPYIAGLAEFYPSMVPPGVTPCPAANAIVPSAVGRTSCSAGVTNESANTGYSHYNGLQMEFRSTNLFHQLTLRTNYTWSKTEDNVSETFGTYGAGNTSAFSQNVLNYTAQEYGLSGFDFPNTWTLTFVEDTPFMRSQQSAIAHLLGGWAFSGTYLLQSGQPFTASQSFINTGSGGVANDIAFNIAYIGFPETSRPFIGSVSAPQTQVGIYAGDACSVYGLGCTLPANELISLNDLNGANNTVPVGTVTQVSKSQVRVIANGAEADSIFGTPFGNAGRNTLRDFHTNTANFTLFKTFRFNDRWSLRFNTTFNNVFNHPNYGNTFRGVDPFIELAGVPGAGITFGDPRVTSTAINSCPAGARCIYFGLKLIF